MTAILSGRYSVVHPGHIKTIRREAALADLLFIYIVDNPDSPFPAKWAFEMIRFCTLDLNNIHIIISPVHFGRCTKKDLEELPAYDAFLSANPQVTEHLRGLGVNVREIERTEGYSSSEIKNFIVKDSLSTVFLNKVGNVEVKGVFNPPNQIILDKQRVRGV